MKIIISIAIVCSAIFSMAQPSDVKLNFIRSEQIFEPKATFQVKLADLDQDGDLDAVTANMHDNFSQVLLNDGNGNFTNSSQKLTQQGHGVDIGDIDRDGDSDLVITCANEGKRTKVYLNDGKANFIETGQEFDDINLSGNSIDLVDIDCDSDLDIVIDYYKHPHAIYLNDGNGTFTKSVQNFPEGDVLIFGELNSDSFIDIFVKIPGKGYSILINNGYGKFEEYWNYNDTLCTHGFYSVAISDFDKDGDNDAFICNGDNTTFSKSKLFVNQGNGQFMDTGKQFGKTKWAWTNVGDLNNDGYLDIFISNFFRSNEIWINDGKGSFYDSGLNLGSNVEATRGFSLGDIDNDGDLDAFIGNFVDGSNEIWINTILNN